jgi:hypothetical protein
MHSRLKNGKKTINQFLAKISAYERLKANAQGALSPDEMDDLAPATVKFDESCQLAFEIKRIADGNMLVFLPYLPDPRSSPFRVATDDRVKLLSMTVKATADLTKRLGRESTDILQKTSVLRESQS